MLDRIIAIGACFDWITPVATFAQDAVEGPSVGYNIAEDSGWSAYAIEDLLSEHGVHTWGLTIFDKVITFRLKESQAAYAQYLMDEAGIPYVGGIEVNHRSTFGAQATSKSAGTSKKASTGLVQQLSDLLDRLAQWASQLG